MNVAHSFVAPQKKIQVAARMSAILLKALVPSVPALPRGSCRTEHSIGRHYFIHPGFIPLSSNCQNGDMLDMSFIFFFPKVAKISRKFFFSVCLLVHAGLSRNSTDRDLGLALQATVRRRSGRARPRGWEVKDMVHV